MPLACSLSRANRPSDAFNVELTSCALRFAGHPVPSQHLGAILLSMFKQISTPSTAGRSATGVQTPPAGPAAADLAAATTPAMPAAAPLFMHVAKDVQGEKACR